MLVRREIGRVLRRIPIRKRWTTAGLLVACLHGPSWAWAAPPTPSATPYPAEPHERARAFARQGRELYRDRQFEAAREALAHAYELDPQSETLAELALAELEAGHPVEAAGHLRQYLVRSDVPAKNLDAARVLWLPRAEAKTARVDVFVGPSADIRVDGLVPERLPLPPGGPPPAEPFVSLVIAEGQHELSVQDGAIAHAQRLVASGGDVLEVHSRRQPDAPTAPIWTVSAIAPPRPPDESRPRARWITVLAVEGAAVVMAGVGIGFGSAFEHSKSEADGLVQGVGDSGCLSPANMMACSEVNRDRQAEGRYAVAANASYGVAGALAVLGVATWLLWPSAKGPSAGALRPVAVMAPRTAEAALTGAW